MPRGGKYCIWLLRRAKFGFDLKPHGPSCSFMKVETLQMFETRGIKNADKKPNLRIAAGQKARFQTEANVQSFKGSDKFSNQQCMKSDCLKM